MLSIGQLAQVACIWEATARKPGNVHRFHDYEDVTYVDFILSAAAIAPWLDSASERPIGETILLCAKATKRVTRTNTNLGIILLLAPLASVANEECLRPALEEKLSLSTVKDAELCYQAIAVMRPSGLGEVEAEDVSQAPTQNLRQVMGLAAERDTIALQYVNVFEQVFAEGVPFLEEAISKGACAERAIQSCFLRLLAKRPDSLIARKCGLALAEEASRRASETTLEDLDLLEAWLCAEGHSRNPGTTADLVTASLFVALLQGKLSPDHLFY